MQRIEIRVEERKDGSVAVSVSRPRGGTPREQRAVAVLVAAARCASLPPPTTGYAESDESELERALRLARQTTG